MLRSRFTSILPSQSDEGSIRLGSETQKRYTFQHGRHGYLIHERCFTKVAFKVAPRHFLRLLLRSERKNPTDIRHLLCSQWIGRVSVLFSFWIGDQNPIASIPTNTQHRQRLHIVSRKDARLPVQFTHPPSTVIGLDNVDDIILVKRQVSFFCTAEWKNSYNFAWYWFWSGGQQIATIWNAQVRCL